MFLGNKNLFLTNINNNNNNFIQTINVYLLKTLRHILFLIISTYVNDVHIPMYLFFQPILNYLIIWYYFFIYTRSIKYPYSVCVLYIQFTEQNYTRNTLIYINMNLIVFFIIAYEVYAYIRIQGQAILCDDFPYLFIWFFFVYCRISV